MEKDYYGFSKKEFIAVIVIFFTSVFTIFFCGIRLLHKFYQSDKQTVSEIRQRSSELVLLNSLLSQSTFTQRASLNLLIYTKSETEVKQNTEEALRYRDSIKQKLLTLESRLDFNTNDKRQIELAGYKYLNTNEEFLNIVSKKDQVEKADSFNVNAVRPALRAFSDLCRNSSNAIIARIDEANATETSLCGQLEFWLLLLALAPWLYMGYRVIAIIWRIIFWKIF